MSVKLTYAHGTSHHRLEIRDDEGLLLAASRWFDYSSPSFLPYMNGVYIAFSDYWSESTLGITPERVYRLEEVE